MTIVLDRSRRSVVWSDADGPWRIEATPQPGDAFVDQLEQTWFGSGGLRYRRLDIAGQLSRLVDPLYLELYREQSLVGTYALSSRIVHAGSVDIVGFYRGLLTISEDAAGQGLGRLLASRTLDWLGSQAVSHGAPVISWGCIERNNVRSLGLLASLGAEEVATLESMTVYRQWPRRKVRVDRIDDPTQATLREAIVETAADCGVLAKPVSPGAYFAVTDDKQILAGARAVVTRVDMERIGGLWDFMHEYLFRHVPAARRRFDPRNFTYLRLSDLIVREEAAALWPDFITTLMAEHGVHMAMLVLDPRSAAARWLAQAGVFGRFAAATRQELAVLVTGWQLDTELLDRLRRQPIAIGPTDL